MTKTMLAILATLPLAVPAASAQPQAAPIGSLEKAALLAPRDGGAAIELANAYRRAGRTAEANNAYRHALTLDNVMMETRLGDSIWSREIARRQLSGQLTVSQR